MSTYGQNITIAHIEYFVDTDPGFGLATAAIRVSPSAVVNNLNVVTESKIESLSLQQM